MALEEIHDHEHSPTFSAEAVDEHAAEQKKGGKRA
jgi:hypothetical protein